MPNCFTLTRKSDLQAGPVKLSVIDNEMCDHFEVVTHPTNYHAWWYDIIGFKLALGKNWEAIREDFLNQKEEHKSEPEYVAHLQHLLDITDWLEANFTTDCWYQVHKD